MARPLRIEYPDAVYHVSNRGEEGDRIFPGPNYFKAFLDGAAAASERFNVQILAYCLLGNEYHLLVKTPEGNLSRFMRQVNGVYTQNFQLLRNEAGSVFRSRYKSVLLQPENICWACPVIFTICQGKTALILSLINGLPMQHTVTKSGHLPGLLRKMYWECCAKARDQTPVILPLLQKVLIRNLKISIAN